MTITEPTVEFVVTLHLYRKCMNVWQDPENTAVAIVFKTGFSANDRNNKELLDFQNVLMVAAWT